MSDRDIPSKQKLIDMLAERSRKHDAFRLAETAFSDGRADGYADEMNAFDIAHGEVLDWLNDTDHLDELLGFLRAAETPDDGCICDSRVPVPCPIHGPFPPKAAEPRELAPSEAASFEKAFAASPRRIETSAARSFQDRVFDWARDCFGEKDTTSREMRTFRFLEEALELAQACGCSQDAAARVLAYVYGRPTGEIAQEAGGVMVSLAVLCQAFQLGMSRCGEAELARVLGKIEHIRARHAAKPDFAVPAVKTGPAPTCKTHGVELAFDGDECWECKKERQL